MFLKDIQSIKNALALFNKFGAYSGLKLNLEKTEIIPVGMSQLSYQSLPNDLNHFDILTLYNCLYHFVKHCILSVLFCNIVYSLYFYVYQKKNNKKK